MFQILCLIVFASAAFALKKPIQGFDDAKHELLKDLAENGNLAESLIDIILEQGMTIKAMEKTMYTMEKKMNNMEKKMNTITETDHQKGDQIMAKQERITDLETIIEKQNQDLADLYHEKDVLNDTIVDQKADMASIETDMMPIIEAVQKEEKRKSIKASSRVQKRATTNVTNVAFSTWLSTSLYHLSIGHVIKPDQVFINDGNGYDKQTGVFTVPTSGVYLLICSIDTDMDNHLEVELKVDSRNMGNVKAYNKMTMASKSIITRLTAGQSFWLETIYYGDVGVNSTTFSKFTTFSGALLY